MCKKSLINFPVALVVSLILSSCINVSSFIPNSGGDASKKSSKEITEFSIAGRPGIITGTNISVTLPYGSSVVSLTPAITHTGASIIPALGVAQDFTSPVTYTVTAANGSIKGYTVTVTIALSDAKEITAFSIAGQSGTITGSNISVTLPYDSSVTSLTPSITYTGTVISPALGIAQDFTNPVIYTVTAADGASQAYRVTVTVALNSAKEITDFSISGQSGVITGTNISVTLPYNSSVTSLIPSITYTGVKISPALEDAQNFTNPVTYTVTAANGTSQAYKVTVNVALNPAKEIIDFSISGQSGVFNGTDILVTLPYDSSVTSLTPLLTHTGSNISPAIGVAQNFTEPVTYTVTAADGTSQAYKVTVTVALNPAKEITAFSIAGQSGTITGTNISVTLPYGSSVTSLTPSITYTGVNISPAVGLAQNFNGSVIYTVTAANGTSQAYTVTVSVALNPAKEITAFSIAGISGSITGTNISVMLPSGISIDSLTPLITHTGVSINPAVGVAQDFTNSKVYKVTAADNSIKEYTVTVTLSSFAAGQIATFAGDDVGFDMAYVPGGLTFPTGTDDKGTATVSSAYWVGLTEVTYELWNTVRTWAVSNGYSFANSGAGINKQYPATSMNWRDAMVWMNALTEWYNAKNSTNYTCVYYSDAAFTQPLRSSTNNIATGTIKTVSLNKGGSGYPNGSVVLNVVQAGASGGTVTANVVGGIVKSVVLKDAGTGYAYTNAVATSTGGTGTGCKINILEITPPLGSEDNPYVKASATGFRMLTGNEWELAARYKDGTSWTPGNYASGSTAIYSNATETQKVEWYSANSGSTAHVVGTAGNLDPNAAAFSGNANSLGLYDMSGNAWEWTYGWYSVGVYREIRGGCWMYDSDLSEVGFAYGLSQSAALNVMGFRVARTNL